MAERAVQQARSASTSGSTGTVRKAALALDKELRKQALAAKRGESTLAAKGGGKGGKGGGKNGAPKAKPNAKPKAAAKGAPKPPGTVCPFFQKTGSCANCDMVHTLLTGQGQVNSFHGGTLSFIHCNCSVDAL